MITAAEVKGARWPHSKFKIDVVSSLGQQYDFRNALQTHRDKLIGRHSHVQGNPKLANAAYRQRRLLPTNQNVISESRA